MTGESCNFRGDGWCLTHDGWHFEAMLASDMCPLWVRAFAVEHAGWDLPEEDEDPYAGGGNETSDTDRPL